MPELPEVETIARTLAPQVEGRRITACRLLNPGTWQGDTPFEALAGQRLGTPGRRGKLLILPFVGENGEELFPVRHCAASGEPAPSALLRHGPDALLGLGVHLKMTGRMFVYPQEVEAGPHTRAVFALDGGLQLFFDDARKFGYVKALTPAALADWPFWTRLGPEPLEIGATDFAARFAGRSAAIKALLLDQTVVAGCGNIYADESLFRAGIHPEARGSALSPAKLRRLHAALCEVLNESIDACGSSIKDYRTARGDAGAFQNAFRVYGRGGQKCFACGAELRSCRVAGRTTVFCPRCQK